MLGFTRLTRLLGGALLICAAWCAGAQAQEVISVSRITFPGALTTMVDVIKEKGFDRKHGIDLVPKNYSTIAAFYAATLTGEVDMSVIGPWLLQKASNEGSKVRGLFTFNRISSLGVVTADPNIKTIQDLKGKSIAADMGSGEYQLLAMYGKSVGVVFGKDVTVVQAGPPLARSQLGAGRVDAAMSWEINTTVLLQDNPKYRRFIGGETAWESLSHSKSTGWQLLLSIHQDAVDKHKKAIQQLLAMWQDGAKFVETNPDEAAKINAKTNKLPEGVLQEAVGSKRLTYEINPVWEGEHDGIWKMFQIGVDQKYVERMPDPAVLYKP